MRKAQREPEDDYLEAAVRFADARDRHDSRSSNKAHDKLIDAVRRIRRTRSDGGAAFFALLTGHPRALVRLWAALHLFPLDKDAAVLVMNSIASSESSEAQLDAKITLEEITKGRLDVEWYLREE
jgi:hypothetical protein